MTNAQHFIVAAGSLIQQAYDEGYKAGQAAALKRIIDAANVAAGSPARVNPFAVKPKSASTHGNGAVSSQPVDRRPSGSVRVEVMNKIATMPGGATVVEMMEYLPGLKRSSVDMALRSAAIRGEVRKEGARFFPIPKGEVASK
jgi:hypothetical protein